MIVTKIERQRRHPDRVNVYLDGVFAFGLDEEVLARHGLRKGDAIDESTRELLLGAEAVSRARARALRFLGYRLRSEREVRAKLAQAEFPEGVIDQAVAQIVRLGMIDDRRFAAAFVHDARLRKATGDRLLRRQLLAKGVARELVDATLAAENDDAAQREDAYRAARKLRERYRASRRKTPAETERRRIAQFLQRRGFGWEIIAPVLQRLFPTTDPHSEESDDGIPGL